MKKGPTPRNLGGTGGQLLSTGIEEGAEHTAMRGAQLGRSLEAWKAGPQKTKPELGGQETLLRDSVGGPGVHQLQQAMVQTE